MSEWIKLHAGVFHHPKTMRLARLMGADANCAVGNLAALWTWTLEYAPEGDLSQYEAEEVESALGCPSGFLLSAESAGYLERTDDGLFVHDWEDYAGAILDMRQRNAERMRNARAKNVHSTCQTREGLEREKEREKALRARAREAEGPRARKGAVDNSQNGNGSHGIECWVCHQEITDEAVESRFGLRHKDCVVPSRRESA